MQKKSKKKTMKPKSSPRIPNHRTPDLQYSYPSLYQLNYDLILSFKIAIYESQLEWIGNFYALQWLDGSTIFVAVPKSRRMGKRATRKNRAAAQGKFSYGVDRPPLSWLWCNLGKGKRGRRESSLPLRFQHPPCYTPILPTCYTTQSRKTLGVNAP
jgi:hypothetical protein